MMTLGLLNRCSNPKCILMLVLLGLAAFAPQPLRAQSRWSAQLGGEASSVSIGSLKTVWHSERLTVGYTGQETGGFYLWTEQQMRGSQRDVVFGASGYRRLGDWTIAGGASAAPDSKFWYRSEFNSELSRRIVSTFVLSTAYRFMDFPTATIHQVQPALTWYNPRGEVQARLYITRNETAARTTRAVLARSLVKLNGHLDVTGVFAYGDRIFDIASLPYGAAQSWTGRLGFRVHLSSHDSIEIGGGYAHENPSFYQRTIAFSYRRAL